MDRSGVHSQQGVVVTSRVQENFIPDNWTFMFYGESLLRIAKNILSLKAAKERWGTDSPSCTTAASACVLSDIADFAFGSSL